MWHWPIGRQCMHRVDSAFKLSCVRMDWTYARRERAIVKAMMITINPR